MDLFEVVNLMTSGHEQEFSKLSDKELKIQIGRANV